MKNLLVLGAVIAIAGCGGTPPADLAECEAIADDSVTIINDIVEETGDLTQDEYVTKMMQPDAEGVDLSSEVEGRLAELADRIETTGCGDLAELHRERADQVEGEGFLADLFRKGMERGEPPTSLSP